MTVKRIIRDSCSWSSTDLKVRPPIAAGSAELVAGHFVHDPHAAPVCFEANIDRARSPIVVTAPSATSDTIRS